MKNKLKVIFLGGVLLFSFYFALSLISYAGAHQVDKITWCHVEPNGNQETLHLPLQALEQAGHVNAQGNPLHAGDHPGECVEPSVSPTVSPDLSPSPTDEPSATLTPTNTPSTQTNTGVDKNSCTVKDCNTEKGKTVVPQAPPSTGYPSCDVPNTCIDK